MPDKCSRRKERERRDWLQTPSRRLRLYSDEDMPAWANQQLRGARTNVLTTHQARNAGRDDKFQAAFAARTRRVLITRNVKHFLDDRLVPLHATRGVIALDVSSRDSEAFTGALGIVTQFLVPWAELYENMKIRVSTAGGVFRYVERTGAVRTVALSLDQLFDGRYPTDGEDRGIA
jgi:hypothetical protein